MVIERSYVRRRVSEAMSETIAEVKYQCAATGEVKSQWAAIGKLKVVEVL